LDLENRQVDLSQNKNEDVEGCSSALANEVVLLPLSRLRLFLLSISFVGIQLICKSHILAYNTLFILEMIINI
jgi:hypothetical protein